MIVTQASPPTTDTNPISSAPLMLEMTSLIPHPVFGFPNVARQLPFAPRLSIFCGKSRDESLFLEFSNSPSENTMFRTADCRGSFACALAIPAIAHDTWVQTNTNVVRTGDAVHIDLLLGNHGNDHRDFKIAGKLSAESVQSFVVIAPDGKTYDLKPDLTDLGYAPKEGFLTAKFVPAKAGLYVAAQSSDGVVNHGKPVRSVRSAKAYFVVSASLDKVPAKLPGFDKPLGHKLELVPEANPVAPMGPGQPIKVKLLFNGKPLANTKVSFVPRGVTLKEGTDAEYDRTTDKGGRASFTPKTGNYYLVVAHHDTDEKSDKYEATKYAATMTVLSSRKSASAATTDTTGGGRGESSRLDANRAAYRFIRAVLTDPAVPPRELIRSPSFRLISGACQQLDTQDGRNHSCPVVGRELVVAVDDELTPSASSQHVVQHDGHADRPESAPGSTATRLSSRDSSACMQIR